MAQSQQNMQQQGGKRNYSFRSFGGMNTQAIRQMIGEKEFAWLENVMPIGDGNLQTIPAASAALITLSSKCFYMASGVISNTAYMYMFSIDGSCTQVNLTTYEKVVVGAAGTFSGTGSAITQWENTNICIIDATKGYFSWDGTTLTTYNGTAQSVTVNAGGIGFTNANTTTLTPSSGSARFSVTLGCNLVTLVGAGSNYAVGDVLTVSGGTFTSAATITVSAVTSGAISGFNLTTPGVYTITPTNNVSVTGGHGTGATFTLVFGIGAVTVVTPGSGYVAVPTITIGGAGSGTGASLTVNMGITATGTTIATYAGRIWIGFGRTIIYSAPSSFSDFSPVDLGGSLIITDDTLTTNISALVSSNDYLYIFGASSVNIISNVSVTNPTLDSSGSVVTPAVTTFSNTNITSNMGTDMGLSIVPYFRTMAYVSDYGCFGLTGSTSQKISSPLDGLFKNILFSNFEATGGQCVIFGELCLVFLVSYNDPLLGSSRPLLLIFFDKKWFVSSQISTINLIAQAAPDPDVPVMYATDGLNLYSLFTNSSATIAQKIQTRLWDMGNPLAIKQAFKVGIESVSPSTPASLAVSIDTEYGTNPYNFTASNAMIWYNNSGGVISWTNNALGTIVWTAAGFVFLRSDVNGFGNYLGLTITATTPGITYSGLHMQYKETQAEWSGAHF